MYGNSAGGRYAQPGGPSSSPIPRGSIALGRGVLGSGAYRTPSTPVASRGMFNTFSSNRASEPDHEMTPLSSMSEKFSLMADPKAWGAVISPEDIEPDDHLHAVDPKRDLRTDSGTFLTLRGLTNLGCLAILCAVLLALFVGGPIFSALNAFGPDLRHTNATGQIPKIPGNWGLIDLDTPQDAYTLPSYMDGEDMVLIFSDEFDTEGRSFYAGDDPYWEAVDLHYWATGNLEWYDPSAITTVNGSLQITLSNISTHNLNYQGGMMSTWNKFCFTGGLVLTSVSLPGDTNARGLWPAVWAMGNLGRAGYGASLDGTWPYSYDACDVGTVAHQMLNGQPEAASKNGPGSKDPLSLLPGQRLSRCTCPGESHPGPVHRDGSYVGRSAPEIDMFEAQVAGSVGHVSQSGQWAPFDYAHEWLNTSSSFSIDDPSITVQNTYLGGTYQEASSCVTVTDQNCYHLTGGCFSLYGFEYKPGFDDAYITWLSNGKKAWTVFSEALGPNPKVEISGRPVPQEPMYLLANLGISENFGDIDYDLLTFPAVLLIDWIRVYQRKDSINVGCDPEDFPTAAYIKEYLEAYTNPNLTTWTGDYKQPMPKNSFLGQC